ncbi:Xaa-Pro aminopeptidase [Methanomicrobium sp. W14]|uniref:M24 family metallopeptidase n=1 Tax=Methanomicrobium sp. W14 TaxID=2817839 RepID=UPI001AE9EB45|nr:Xaa-Pro peptidase family protein [Methanomicrobium sp. W14]MBP2132972.1 Xaa-Pro aminopeptidase [Methanomicrobium sp. W14]
MQNKIPSGELKKRMKYFHNNMDSKNPEWEYTVIFGKVNQYYFTGTMQDGVLIIPRDEEPVFYVRNSYERAKDESCFSNLKQMQSFRDAAEDCDIKGESLYTDTEVISYAQLKRFLKHFHFDKTLSADRQIADTRSVKTGYELNLMIKSGEIHRHVTEDLVPEMLREGMSEAELGTELYKVFVDEGHQGIVRFGMFDTEIMMGHICFGDSSIYPSYFNGASGNRGVGPYAPVLGSKERKLKPGDLVYLDVGCGYQGYQTDKTMTYMFQKKLPEYAIDIHNKCVEIQNQIASMLKPGNTPSEIYRSVMESLENDFKENFMGYKDRKVRFLGHGIGLLIDEMPVIAKGFDDPVNENMTFAVEPKKGIKDIGMVGIENTFIVKEKGGICITGNKKGLILV